jgi:hypothetical protein
VHAYCTSHIAPLLQVSRFPSPIHSLALSHLERHLLVGLESGEVCVFFLDATYLRRRMHKNLSDLGF